MTTVQCWTGRETKLLRGALRLSIRAFAAQLGVDTRTVNKWEARQASITLLPYMQQVLDTALARSADEVKARFAAAVDASQRASTLPSRRVPPDCGLPRSGSVSVPLGLP
ncbi:MAG: helix-turn-helix domain-containing protein [Pseudonocardiaceae bacterium]